MSFYHVFSYMCYMTPYYVVIFRHLPPWRVVRAKENKYYRLLLVFEIIFMLSDAQESTSEHASTLGLLFGGFFLGALSTAGIVFIIYRRFKSSLIRR